MDSFFQQLKDLSRNVESSVAKLSHHDLCKTSVDKYSTCVNLLAKKKKITSLKDDVNIFTEKLRMSNDEVTEILRSASKLGSEITEMNEHFVEYLQQYGYVSAKLTPGESINFGSIKNNTEEKIDVHNTSISDVTPSLADCGISLDAIQILKYGKIDNNLHITKNDEDFLNNLRPTNHSLLKSSSNDCKFPTPPSLETVSNYDKRIEKHSKKDKVTESDSIETNSQNDYNFGSSQKDLELPSAPFLKSLSSTITLGSKEKLMSNNVNLSESFGGIDNKENLF